jgi:urease accessory protein
LLTTPARQVVPLAGAWAQAAACDRWRSRGAHVEWLPQETIVYDGARADIAWDARLERRCAAHRLGHRLPRPHRVRRALRARARCAPHRASARRRLAWRERARIGRDALVRARRGLGGEPVFATLVCAAPRSSDDSSRMPRGEAAAARARDAASARARGALSRLVDEAARDYFTALWSLLSRRLGREAWRRASGAPERWRLTPREKDKLLIFTAALVPSGARRAG